MNTNVRFLFFCFLASCTFAGANANCNANIANKSFFIYQFTSSQITPSSDFIFIYLFYYFAIFIIKIYSAM